ncbi:MAG: PRC-barrel domain-containing protein [Chloroflexi bacterium]|nr:PRC-barrel domain-containing protein [Chloroflexota bacterium]
MISTGMQVISSDGRIVGTVNKVIEANDSTPPGLILALASRFSLRPRYVALTTYDVKDVLADTVVLLRISRWEVHNRQKLLSFEARRRQKTLTVASLVSIS